jgi:hypothetical protein
MTVGGSINVTGNTTVAGLAVTNITGSGSASIGGNTTISGTASLGGAATIASVSVPGNTTVVGNSTISGTLVVSGAQSVNGGLWAENLASENRLFMKSPAGFAAWLTYYSSGERWLVGRSDDPETGSNAGSDYQIVRESDAGAPLGIPFIIQRRDGLVVLPEVGLGVPTVSGGVYKDASGFLKIV